MILRAERAAVLGQPGEHLICPCLVNQNVTAIASLDRLFYRTGVARDDDAAVRGVESVSIAFHCMAGRESCDSDVGVSVDDSGLDFMGVHLPALDSAGSEVRSPGPSLPVSRMGLRLSSEPGWGNPCLSPAPCRPF